MKSKKKNAIFRNGEQSENQVKKRETTAKLNGPTE